MAGKEPSIPAARNHSGVRGVSVTSKIVTLSKYEEFCSIAFSLSASEYPSSLDKQLEIIGNHSCLVVFTIA